GLAAPRARPAAVQAGALVAALAFAVHPLRVESVAWVTERRDVLSGAFFLLAVLTYLRAVGRDTRPDRRWLGLSLLAFTGALLSKEIPMTLPLVLVLLDIYPLGRLRWPETLVEKAPFVLVGAAGAAVSAISVATDIGFTGLGRLGVPARLALVAYRALFYPLQTFLPFGVASLHEFPLHVRPL